MGIDLRDKNLTILDEGVDVSSGTSSINFEGSGVNVAAVGDNVTVIIPGGAGNTTFYLNQTVTQTPYKEFSSVATSAVEQVVPLTVAGGATSVIAEYMTPTGFPGTTQIPAGLWQLFLHFNAGAVGQNWIIRPTVYKRSSGGTETLLFTADPEIVTNMSTTSTMYTCDGVFPSTALLTTDRILVRISMQNTTGVSQTVNFRTEGSQHYSVAATTLNQVITSGSVTAVTGTAPVVSSGGATPAISMPAATNLVDGYLTAADWTAFKNKASYTPRVQSVTSAATVTPTNLNDLVKITAQAVALTLANPTGTWDEGQSLMIRIKDNATARVITWDTNYRAIGVTLPTTTVLSKTTYVGLIYNSTDTKWDAIGVVTQA